jgi:hypothetical protein
MSLTTTLTFDRSYLALASAPNNYVQCGTSGSIGGGGQRTDVTAIEAGFRNYANFRTRLIIGSAQVTVQTLTLRALTAAQVALVQSWIGKTVLFRDTYGRRIYGSYTTTTTTNIPLTSLADVSLTLQTVSYTEGV